MRFEKHAFIAWYEKHAFYHPLKSLIYPAKKKETIGLHNVNTTILTVVWIFHDITHRVPAIIWRASNFTPGEFYGDYWRFISKRRVKSYLQCFVEINTEPTDIKYIYDEDLEGAIIFLDQEKALDRVEWVDACLKK